MGSGKWGQNGEMGEMGEMGSVRNGKQKWGQSRFSGVDLVRKFTLTPFLHSLTQFLLTPFLHFCHFCCIQLGWGNRSWYDFRSNWRNLTKGCNNTELA